MPNVWVVRPKPHGILRIEEFRTNAIVAIGWPVVPDLTGCDFNAIKRHLREYYPKHTNRELGQAAGTINRLVNEMQKEDIVVVPSNDGVYVGEIAGDYQWDSANASDDRGYSHQRPVRWLRDGQPVLRQDLPTAVRDALKGHQTVYLAKPEVGQALLSEIVSTNGAQSTTSMGTKQSQPSKQRTTASPEQPTPDQIDLGNETADEAIDLAIDPNKRSIFTNKADPSIQELFLRYKDGDLILQPDFQRQFVWDEKRMSRLIESALLDVPLPIIYLAEDREARESVIDGQQRLTSFFRFLDSQLKLTGLKVLKELNGKTFMQLDKPM